MAGDSILVVEDEDSLRELQTILFAARGYRVTGVADGNGALAAIAETPPDLVLLDLMIPEPDGFRVCRSIKENERTRAIPVVMLTARKSSRDQERGWEAGADAYLTKPFRSAKLIEVVEGLLAARRPSR